MIELEIMTMLGLTRPFTLLMYLLSVWVSLASAWWVSLLFVVVWVVILVLLVVGRPLLLVLL